jgi:hypothetical protein
MLTKEVEIPKELFESAVNDYDCKWANGKIKIKRFTFGDANAISREASKIKASNFGGEIKLDANIDPTEIQVLTLLKGVVEAPWTVNDVGAINELPVMIANWALKEIEEFNTITFKKKEN